MGRNWDGPVDHSVDVIGFDDENGNVVSTIVDSCHPHILGPENRLISPDYPGHLRKTVEDIVGEVVVHQGYAGNQGPVHTFVGEVEVARKAGKILGLQEASKVRISLDPFQKEELIEIVKLEQI